MARNLGMSNGMQLAPGLKWKASYGTEAMAPVSMRPIKLHPCTWTMNQNSFGTGREQHQRSASGIQESSSASESYVMMLSCLRRLGDVADGRGDSLPSKYHGQADREWEGRHWIGDILWRWEVQLSRHIKSALLKASLNPLLAESVGAWYLCQVSQPLKNAESQGRQ